MRKPQEFTVHMVGHGHIDPTWLWRWTEGYEEVRATFRSALDRMNETPEFKFSASSACFYAWVKACDPGMFDEIRQRVQEGRWEIAGGWWVEPDCNIPAGESFVRHGLYSQRFFEAEFGVRATVGFNPDTFGHAGTLPQIFGKSGIDCYAYMRPCPEFEMHYPEGTTFWWRAKDGSAILACNIPYDYSVGGDRVRQSIERLPGFPHLNEGQTHILGFYGVGNHGGGPTKRAIAAVREAQQSKSLPKVVFSTLREYFDGFLKTTPKKHVPAIDTDLQHHARGCYSAHSGVKRLNRAAEHALMAAERFATAAWLAKGHPFPQARIAEAWKLLLYNQFHDILAGTSIEASYEDTRDQLGAARNTAAEIRNESLQVIARDIDTSPDGNTVIVVNPLPWTTKQTVKAQAIAWRGLTPPIHFVDQNEQVIASQTVPGERIGHTDYMLTADLPAFGYRSYHARSGARAVEPEGMLEASRDHLENDWWRIEFDVYTGEMCRLYDKKADAEVLTKGNVLSCMVDQSDTWSHGYDEWRVEAGRFADARLELLHMGDICATVRVVQRFRASTAGQFITLHRDVDTIDCVFRVNWQERHTMLKLGYETTIRDGGVFCDVPYGCQERNTDGFEEPGQQWMDLTGALGRRKYGLAVLNDSKYGFDVRDGVMRLTLLRSPAYAHHDRGRYDASEPWPIMDQGWHTIRVRLVPHTGNWQNADVVRRAWELNQPAFVHIESAHKGTLSASLSFLDCRTPNVALTVLKKSEDGDDIVVRGYEITGKSAKATVRIHGVRKPVRLEFGPHEIKTVRIDPATGKTTAVNLLEEEP